MEILNLVSLDIALNVLGRTLVIFFFAFLVLRLLGKRSLAHLTYLDLLLIIALGSAVGDVMIYDESVVQITSSMIAIAIVGVIVKILGELSSRYQKAGHLIIGTARLLVKDGKVIKQAIRQEDMNEEDLMRMLRERDIHDIKKVKKAFIESDGELSVVTGNKVKHK